MGVPNDCKKAMGRELSIFLLPRQICLHIFLHCLRSLLRQRTAIEIFWQAALCFHFHKRCTEGVKEREKEGGTRGLVVRQVGEVLGGKGKWMLSEFRGTFEDKEKSGGEGRRMEGERGTDGARKG